MTLPTNPHTTYTSPKGRQYRLVGLENSDPKWIGREIRYLWTSRIKFLDDGSNADLFFGYNDNFIKIHLLV